MNFTNDPLTALLLGVDDDKLEDMNLEEVIDRVIRKRIALQPDASEEGFDAKVAKAKKRLTNFIAKMGEETTVGYNPFAPLLLLLVGGAGGLVTDGFRGIFTDKDGNEMPEDVFKNEFMPLSGKAYKFDTLIKAIEELTEENSCGVMVPDIVRDIFALKDELLSFLKGREEELEEELKKIIGRDFKKRRMKTSLTIEQSADLIKLGVDAKFATGETLVGGAVFTLADLLGLLPKKINYHNELLWLHIYVSDNTEKWCAKYQNNYGMDEADTFMAATELADCLYLLLQHLLTRKLAEP